MMIKCTLAALHEHDHQNALEYILAVASVDDHPDVVRTLAITLVRIIDAQKMAVLLSATKRDLVDALASGGELDYGAIKRCLDQDTIFHILELVRLRAKTLQKRHELDNVACKLIENLKGLVIKEGEAPPATSNADQQVVGVVKEIATRTRIGLSYALSILVVITSVPVILYLSFQYFLGNIAEFKFSISNCPASIGGGIRVLWQFLLTDTGKISLASLALFKIVLHWLRRLELHEARHMVGTIGVALFLLLSVLISDSPNIVEITKNVVKMCYAQQQVLEN
jgi:hypothetical protein